MVAFAARPQVLVDGHNIDGVLGEILGHRPKPNERPRWDRVKDYVSREIVSHGEPWFVVDEHRVWDGAFPFYRSLRTMRWHIEPASKVGGYPGNDDPVDELILDKLHEWLVSSRTESL